MEKPDLSKRNLKDWDHPVTNEWIEYAQTAQTSHCRNISANEAGAKYSEELFSKIDDLVLMHAFGASAKKDAKYSVLKMNFNSPQRHAAENVRKMILKYGKTKEAGDTKSSVSVQVISVTMMLVDGPKEPKEKTGQEGEKSSTASPGLAQVVVFRVLKPTGGFCFIDHTSRYYSDWNDYLANNKLPRCKMCYPKNGEYKFKEMEPDNNNNTEKQYALDLALSESVSCTNWERFKAGSLTVVSYASLVAGVVCIVAVPFTGGASLGVYAGYATTLAGWVSVGCIFIGAAANLGSIWDKFWHDESFGTELASLAMIVLHYGVAKYNAKILGKVKDGVAVTRAELVFLTVLNCTRFAYDSIMFAMTFARLVYKAYSRGMGSITALELIQFSMSAYFYGKTVFEPKTGYGIIKQAQQQYLMEEKRAVIKDEGAQKKYDAFVEPEERFGDKSKTQTMKDDVKGFTCSQEVCDELNNNAAVIRTINSCPDLNQFFLNLSDLDVTLRMTKDGKITMNGEVDPYKAGENLQAQATDLQNYAEENLYGRADVPENTYKTTSDRAQRMYDAGERLKGVPAQSTDPSGMKSAVATPENTSAVGDQVYSQGESTKSGNSSQQDAGGILQGILPTTQGDLYSQMFEANILSTNQSISRSTYGGPSSQDDDEKKEDCICRNVKVSLLYANMCSVGPRQKSARKIRLLKNLISRYRPHIIAIVESWLTASHDDAKILALLDARSYQIVRQDRGSGHHPLVANEERPSVQMNRRGGGVLVLWKSHSRINFKLERQPAEDHEDNIVNLDLFYKFNCDKCCKRRTEKKFGLTIVYRRPGPFTDQPWTEYDEINSTVVNRLIHLMYMYTGPQDGLDYHRWVMFGDFNWNPENAEHRRYLAGLAAVARTSWSPLSANATHRSGNILDHVIGSSGFVVNPSVPGSPVVEVSDLISDHAALIFSLKLGQDSPNDRQCNARQCKKSTTTRRQ